MTTQTEALKSAIEFAEFCLEELDLSYMASNQAKRLVDKAKEALAQPEQEPNHVATVAEVHMSRYTIEWTNGPLPEGAKLYDASQRKETEQEPVAWIRPSGKAMLKTDGHCHVYASEGMSNHSTPLYTTPPQRKPLTDEQIRTIGNSLPDEHKFHSRAFARAIEAAHSIKE